MSNPLPLLDGLTLRIDSSTTDDDSAELISTVKISILNASNEKIGHLKLFIVPRAVGQSGEYFYLMDGLDQDLAAFAYRCTTDTGFLHSDICYEGETHRWNHVDSRKIAFLEKILIEEPLRGRGIGTWAVDRLMKMYERKINMIVTWPSPLSRCEPTRPWFDAPPPTPQEEAAFQTRKDRVIRFYSKIGFRRLGNTQFFGLSKDPDHPSRHLSAADDPPCQDVPPPRDEQEHIRFNLMNSG